MNAPRLGFSAGGRHWSIEAGPGVQVIDAVITPVPLTQPWYLGLVRHRQALVGVIDPAGLGGAPVVPVSDGTTRVLVLNEPRPIALRVERVYGLIDAPMQTGVDVTNDAVADVDADTDGDHDGDRNGDRDDGDADDGNRQCWQTTDLAQLWASPHFLQAGLLPLAVAGGGER